METKVPRTTGARPQSEWEHRTLWEKMEMRDLIALQLLQKLFQPESLLNPKAFRKFKEPDLERTMQEWSELSYRMANVHLAVRAKNKEEWKKKVEVEHDGIGNR